MNDYDKMVEVKNAVNKLVWWTPRHIDPKCQQHLWSRSQWIGEIIPIFYVYYIEYIIVSEKEVRIISMEFLSIFSEYLHIN